FPDPFDLNAGFLSATVGGATASVVTGASPTVQFRDPLGTGQLTTSELQDQSFQPFDGGTGSFGLNLTLPLQASIGTFSTSTASPPTVTISDPDLFDGVSPSYQTSNYEP